MWRGACVFVVTAVIFAGPTRAAAGDRDPADEERKAGNFVERPADDPELQAASARARANLATFRAALGKRAAGTGQFQVKATFRERDVVEHMWIVDVVDAGSGFKGKLNNAPMRVKSMKIGQVVTVRDADVDDWSFRDGKKRVGGETVVILETRRRLGELAAAEKSCVADPEACYKLAKVYRDGDEGYPLPVVAFRLFDMSCRSGSSKACNAVGWAKLRGEGTSADAAAAGASFAKACPTGKEDRYSCDSRGFALVTGLARTTVDVGQGSRILRAACDAGTIHSCAALAALGAMLGTPVDRQVTDSACQYDPHKVAAHCDRTGDPQSCALAGGWLKVGLCGAPIAAERAKALLDKAAAGGARWPAPAR